MIKTLQLRCKYNKVRYKFSVIRKINSDSGELAVSNVTVAVIEALGDVVCECAGLDVLMSFSLECLEVLL